MTRIPAEEYMAHTELTNRASDVWHKAKENNDFRLLLPHFAGACGTITGNLRAITMRRKRPL